MGTDNPHTNSELEGPIRDAYRALRAIVPPVYLTAPEDDPLPIIVDELDTVYRMAHEAIDAERGPRMTWLGNVDEEAWPSSAVFVVDIDSGTHSDPVGAECLVEWSSGDWKESALARAAKAYQRECRWDAPPGEDGVWVVAASPYRWIEGAFYGNLVGFVVVHDRDDDGEYESIAHIWTATAWRRHGIADQLIRTTRDLLPINTVEEPITSSGQALLGSAASDLLQAT